MNEVQLHLLMNHLPSIGQLAGFCAFITGWVMRKPVVKQTGAWIILVAAIFVMPVNWSGEGAEEAIEHSAGVSDALLHDHEEAAETALVLTLFSGLAAILVISVNRWKQHLTNNASFILLAICFASLFFLVDASHKGGLIRHPELNGTIVDAGGSYETEKED